MRNGLPAQRGSGLARVLVACGQGQPQTVSRRPWGEFFRRFNSAIAVEYMSNALVEVP